MEGVNTVRCKICYEVENSLKKMETKKRLFRFQSFGGNQRLFSKKHAEQHWKVKL
jgi:hypothetical protein